MYLRTFALLWPWVLGILATVLLISGVDDLVPTLLCAWNALTRKPFLVSGSLESPRSEATIAIFVPCWKESTVIGDMVRHNIAAIRYRNYHFFLGVYPNDTATLDVVRQLADTFTNVHIACCPHPGPTSKADCLNWVFQRMILYEQEHAEHFKTVVLHDAEDLIHQNALSIINHQRSVYDMVQVPVLPLPTPITDFTHGIYCDDFAEYQMIDMPARQLCRSFIPSNGVGTGFAREILDRLARERGNLVFNPQSLTEDYEIGVYAHAAGFRQLFWPLKKGLDGFTATREYFPRRFRSAIRQRTRWVTGIGLQSWARDGWRGSWLSKYWFWRDRKGLLANPLSLSTNMLFIAGAADWLQAAVQHRPWHFAVSNAHVIQLCSLTSVMQTVRIGLRMYYTGRIFGFVFALAAPLRTFHGNFINSSASMVALWQYARSQWSGRPLAWNKTEHLYPSLNALSPQKRCLSDILVTDGYLSFERMQAIQDELRSDSFLARYLLQQGLLSEEQLCRAVSLQAGVGFISVDLQRLNLAIMRTLPIKIQRRHALVPFAVRDGRLQIAGPRVPGSSAYEDIKAFTELPFEFHLVTQQNYDELNALTRAVNAHARNSSSPDQTVR